MAHHVYQSYAFVLGGTDIGDANRYVDLFTRDIGLVRAVAQSVRRERSKLRYSLEPYMLTNVSLVRGRDVWRVTGASEDSSVYHDCKHDKEKLILVQKITRLLKRLLHGEEHNEYLFDTLLSFVQHVRDGEYTSEELKAIEHLTVLRILYSLGYVGKKKNFVETTSFDTELLEDVLLHKKEILKEIHQGLEDSHL